MKKLVAFMLCGAMAFSSSIAVFANSTTNYITTQAVEKLVDDDLNDKEKEQISKDITFLNNVGLGRNILKAIDIKDECIVYTLLLNNGLESIMEIKYEDNGDMVIHAEENGRTDDLIITTSGQMFLDGTEIVADIENDEELQREITPRSITTNTMSCPKGRPSDYTDYSHTEKDRNVKLSKGISSMTTSVLASIIGTLAGGLFGGIAYTVAAEIIDAFYDSDSKGLSFKAEIYNYDGSPEYATKYQKCDTRWYSETDYAGDTTKVTSYRIVEYN